MGLVLHDALSATQCFVFLNGFSAKLYWEKRDIKGAPPKTSGKKISRGHAVKALGVKRALQITRFEDCAAKKASLVVYSEKEHREERVVKIVPRKAHCVNRTAMSYLCELTMNILPRKRTVKNAT